MEITKEQLQQIENKSRRPCLREFPNSRRGEAAVIDNSEERQKEERRCY